MPRSGIHPCVVSVACVALWLGTGCRRAPPPPGQPVSPVSSAEATAAGLRFVERVTGGARAGDPLPLVIGIHGRGGSPEHFGEVLAGLTVPARLVLPYGPEPFRYGFTWFPDWSNDAEAAANLGHAADRLAALITEISSKRPTVGKAVVVGFSQGGMLSFALVATHPEVLAAAFPISGFLPPGLLPSTWPAGVAKPPVHAFHGIEDQTVPVYGARVAVKGLQGLGLAAELSEYPGVDHHASPPEQRDIVHAIEAAIAANGARPPTAQP